MGKLNSSLVCCSLFNYCKVYLFWPSWYSQAHTLTVKLQAWYPAELVVSKGHPTLLTTQVYSFPSSIWKLLLSTASLSAANLHLLLIACPPSSSAYRCRQASCSSLWKVLLLQENMEKCITWLVLLKNWKVKKRVRPHRSDLLKTKADTKCEHPLVKRELLRRKMIENST